MEQTGLTNFHVFRSSEECLTNMGLLPDIILIDYEMATLDGLQVMKMIKKTYPYIHVLMISSKKEKELAIDAMKYGAFAFIRKDGNEMYQLNQAVSNIISRYTRHFNLCKHLKVAASYV